MSDIKKSKKKISWEKDIYQSLRNAQVKQVPYVPDAGHSRVIEMVRSNSDMKPIVLTTEEEGVALCCGAWLGGDKSVLLMQSSGVGNCINMLSLLSNCNFPFVSIITMRGEFGEFNSWQVPMSSATEGSLRLMDLNVLRVERGEDVGPTVDAALYSAYSSDQRVAILLSQKLIGSKKW
tara:strand:- start:165 stop:698 length:534 start_codon:yes stop_codon:yes gene_type:complete